MSKEKPTWWDLAIDDHKAYGGEINYFGKQFLAFMVEPNSSVLDVGCGNGLFYKAIKEGGKELSAYKGVDKSFEMIKAAKELYPGVEWEEGNADKLNEEDESWDHVVLFHVVECMEDYEQAIKEALRVARKRVTLGLWKGLRVQETDIIKPSPPDTWESMYSAKRFFKFLRELGYLYPQWVEMYVDGFRYNLFISFDKENHRTEISHV